MKKKRQRQEGRAAGQSVKRGDNLYENVKGVYSLNIVAYNMPEFKGNKDFFWRVYLKDDRNKIKERPLFCGIE